ncbi:MAG TPA: hypothetical protein VF445_14710 [Bordetella sp.]|uniref:hypothetical protein n=1 Tax=Bordetella sp. TaxID=28081 RepID=UPI002ED3AF63
MILHRFFLLASCVMPVAASHAAASWTLPTNSVMTEVASAAKVYGASAEVLSYRTPLDASMLIAFMARQYPGLRDMAVYPGMAVLSDTSGPCSRVVTVSGQAGQGSSGTLSTLCWEQAMSPLPDAWLPAGAELAFEFAEPAGRAGTTQQIWRYAAPPGEIARQAHDNLVRQGWRPARAYDEAGASWQTWQRGVQTLVIDVLGKGEGSVLAVLRFASDPRLASGGAP